jgi:aquaporin Z
MTFNARPVERRRRESMNRPIWNCLAAEALGAAAIVFFGAGAIVVNDLSGGVVTHVGVGIVFGLTVAVGIYALAGVSGAHFNPAVTIALTAAGVCRRAKLLPYLAAQCAGGILGAVLLKSVFPEHATLGGTSPSGAWIQSLALEAVLTGVLLFVIRAVSSGDATARLFGGWAIGAVIAVEAIAFGPICGASMNPARSLGPAVATGNCRDLWLYLIAPVLGGILGVGCWAAVGSGVADDSERTKER